MKKLIFCFFILILTGFSYSQQLYTAAPKLSGINTVQNTEWGGDIVISNFEPIGPVAGVRGSNGTIWIAVNDTLATTNLALVVYKSTNNGNTWAMHTTGILGRLAGQRMRCLAVGDSVYAFFQVNNTVYTWNMESSTVNQVLAPNAYRSFDCAGSSTGAIYILLDSLASNNLIRYSSINGGYTWTTRGSITSASALVEASPMTPGDTLYFAYFNPSTMVSGDTSTSQIRIAKYRQSANGTMASISFITLIYDNQPKTNIRLAGFNNNVWLAYTRGTAGSKTIFGKYSLDNGVTYSADSVLIAGGTNTDLYCSDIRYFTGGTGGFDLVMQADSIQVGNPTNSSDKMLYSFCNIGSTSFSTPVTISSHPPVTPTYYSPSIVEILPSTDAGVFWVGYEGSSKKLYWDRYNLVTNVGNSNSVPSSYKLSQNYPNPFNPSTKIGFEIPKDGFVSLKIYDILGREVSNLVSRVMKAGTYEINFNASRLSSGVYFYSLDANGFKDTKKMVLQK
jgi:hypothetical protein